MKKITLLVVFLFSFLTSSAMGLSVKEQIHGPLVLIAVIAEWCPYCTAWKENVGDAYSQEEVIPLRIVDVATFATIPKWYQEIYFSGKLQKLHGIPAFIIWDEGNERELVRWTGYNDPATFYTMLERAIGIALDSQLDCYTLNICKPKNIEY
ncbi:uncharacterized protein METZ01_LOCUS381830 [marine metagenome]|uniref:Thioredoxin domain-containing protein n=1 Tax=marine metagenome TaxID=408172 RepID=A0A382U3U5_9ZZZZ